MELIKFVKCFHRNYESYFRENILDEPEIDKDFPLVVVSLTHVRRNHKSSGSLDKDEAIFFYPSEPEVTDPGLLERVTHAKANNKFVLAYYAYDCFTDEYVWVAYDREYAKTSEDSAD